MQSGKKTNIIFICHGNICRSPMAEWVFRNMLKENSLEDGFSVSSAAVSYEETGNPIYPPARQTLNRHGIPFGEHHAHRVTPSELRSSDLVIIMDSSNRRLLSRIDGYDPSKTHLLMEYAGSERDVADPWYTGDFEKAYGDIFEGCKKLLLTLKKD